MNLRKEKKINFEVQGNIDRIIIPPMILHTALENGITHGFIKKDTGTFYLKVEKTDKKINILLENDGDNKISQNKKNSGTGNKYIIQRLSELYGKYFKFVSQPKTEGWKVIFEIPDNINQRSEE
jgi:LytS/YehU family sensor histidine kinase